MNKINKFLYVGTFILLYIGVALVSTLHAFDFFKLTNESWIAAILAGSFEIGQAAVLFSILTTKAERGKVMPWVLMFILTAVQIIGNVYACYKYVVKNSMDLLQYFREPIFVWTKLPDEQSTVILTYIASAILPVVALAMTAMITSFLNDNSKDTKSIIENDDIKTKEQVGELPPETGATKAVDKSPVQLEPEPQPEQMITDAAPVPINDDLKKSHLVSI